MSYYGDDDYDYHRRRRPSPHRYRTEQRRSNHFLDPNANSSGLYRTRSTGHVPSPNVYVYNDIIQDSNQSNRSSSSRSPPGLPYPPSPRRRGRDDELAEGIMDLAIENQRLRSRSRGRSDAGVFDSRSDFYERQYRDIERQRSIERERERIKQEYEIKALRDEEKRKADEQRDKDERKRIIADYELKQREESEERKAEEKRMRDKIEREKREAKEKEEKEWKEFLAKQKQKEEEKKEKEQKEEAEFKDEMRKRLASFGYTHAQIEAMVRSESEKKEQTRTTTTTTTMTRWGNPQNPVYPKIHRKYLEIETLRYYELPWEWDSVSLSHLQTPHSSANKFGTVRQRLYYY